MPARGVVFFPEDMIVCMRCKKQIAATSYETANFVKNDIVCNACLEKEMEGDSS